MKELTEEQKAVLVNDVLDGFDFVKVHNIMVASNWKWCGKVPSVAAIIREAEKLLHSVLNSKGDNVSTGTGGFNAYRNGDELTLSFVIEERTAFIDD